MNELSPEEFTWSRWRRCDLISMFGCGHRSCDIRKLAHVLRKYAVGYADGSRVPCRPKANRTAVMFYFQGEHSWTHLLTEEVEMLK